MRSIIIVLACIILFSCGKRITIETQKNGLSITAAINFSFQKLNEKQYKVEGSLIVKNNTNTQLPFSNKDLYIISSKAEARTYMDSMASNFIDVAAIAIPANGEFEEKAYWVVETKDVIDVKNIRLELRN